jgi:hypothetical protein
MEVEMLNRSNLIRVAITFAAITVAAPAFADNSSWLDEQRSISDGYSPSDTSAGAEGRQGFAPSRIGNSSWLERQLSISDGYSPPNEAAGTSSVYVGAKLENAQDDFVQRGLRITDGTTE